MELCLRKTQSGKSPDYRDVIVFEEKLRFQIVVRSHESEKPALSNSCSIKSLFTRKRDATSFIPGITSVSGKLHFLNGVR